MELTYYGANCFKISSKNTSLVVDDNLIKLGLKSVTSESDALAYTQRTLVNEDLEAQIILDGPGEYELDDITVLGIQAKAYTDKDSEMNATMFKVMNNEYQVLFLGHVQPKLDSKILEKIGVVDVLVVPVGGSGYTLDAEDASEVVKLVTPKITIPCHYEDKEIKYDMPMRSIEDFLSKMGVAEPMHIKSLKLKGELEESVIVLDRSN